MRNIRFKQLVMMSYKGVARKIDLDHDVLVVAGGNESGKSSILKTLYYTLGASVRPFAKRWLEGNIVSLLRFTIDEINYKAVRMGNDVYVFNPDNSLCFHDNDKNRIATKLGNLLGLNMTFKDSKGKEKAFSVGYMFMPFYLEQDKGWDQPWDSFTNLSSIGGRRNAMLFHTGIIDDEFYVYKCQLEEAEERKKKVVEELAGNLQFKKEAMKRLENSEILPFTPDEYERGLKEVLSRLSELKESQQKSLQELEKLYAVKYSYQFNIDQLKDNLKEIDKDFKYALKSETEICCPMCGAVVENDAFARFKMLDDRDRCKDLLIENNKKLDDIREKIVEKELLTEETKKEIENLQARINRRDADVSWQEMFEAKLKDYINVIVSERTECLIDERRKLDGIILENKEKMKRLQKNDKKGMVEKDFDICVKGMLRKFGVSREAQKKYTLGSRVKTQGSNVVKHVIAYTYSYYQVMQKYGCPLFAPIVIDEPKQKGVDDNGFTSILDSIINDRPKGSQLILSLNNSELSFIYSKYDLIKLQEGQEVLDKEEFKEVKEEIEELVYGNFQLEA